MAAGVDLRGLGRGRRVDVLRERGHRVVERVRLAREERRDEREELFVVDLAWLEMTCHRRKGWMA